MNPKLTPKDRGLIKGAIRRAFARSALHQKVIRDAIVQHSDPDRPRVKTWCKCAICGKPEAKSYIVVDHIEPVIPLNSSFEEMSLDEAVDRTWCDEKNLQVVDSTCHSAKSKLESKERKKYKQERALNDGRQTDKKIKK